VTGQLYVHRVSGRSVPPPTPAIPYSRPRYNRGNRMRSLIEIRAALAIAAGSQRLEGSRRQRRRRGKRRESRSGKRRRRRGEGAEENKGRGRRRRKRGSGSNSLGSHGEAGTSRRGDSHLSRLPAEFRRRPFSEILTRLPFPLPVIVFLFVFIEIRGFTMRIANDERRRYPGGIARNRILIQYASAYPRAITARDLRDARACVRGWR